MFVKTSLITSHKTQPFNSLLFPEGNYFLNNSFDVKQTASFHLLHHREHNFKQKFDAPEENIQLVDVGKRLSQNQQNKHITSLLLVMSNRAEISLVDFQNFSCATKTILNRD